MKKQLLTTALILLGIVPLFAQQFDLSAEVRARFEYRDGFKTLLPEHVDAATFVSQRSRLNFNYKSEKLHFFMSLQNVRVWGDVPTLATYDANGNSIHEAWGEVFLKPSLSFKVGRQEIIYDDQRMFGSVNWVQQARRHDAFVAKYIPNKNNRLDIGFALNENSESLSNQDYTVPNNKAFQYIWYHTKLKNISLSFLALNNGLVYDNAGTQETAYNQTIGSRIVYAKSKLKTNASVYYQMGDIATSELKAYNVAANMSYKVGAKFTVGLGVEYLSGTDMNTTGTTNNSFNPWFGTNHKFNGWMDYFYVGNHGNSVGLTDINAVISYKKDKFSAKIMPHLFAASADVYNTSNEKMDASLGTEIDFTMAYKLNKESAISIGYSTLFATETMEVLKAGSKNDNSWAWVMFTFKPHLFSTKK